MAPSQPTPQVIYVTPAPTEAIAPSTGPTATPPPPIESIAPLPTETPTPPPTPLPTPAPTATPEPPAPPTPIVTPVPTPQAQQEGEIWFGTGQKRGDLTGRRTTFRSGQGIAFEAYFTEAAGATKVTGSLFKGPNDSPVFAEPLTVGVDWGGMLGTMTGRSAGRYHFQISRGGTLLAEGTFRVK